MSKPDPIEAIERDLSESRANLKDNVHALSEKLTLGKVVDELLFDSKINWDSLGGKTADAMKSVLPGAILGAGAALLLANGGLSGLIGRSRGEDDGEGKRSGYHPGFDPVDDWRTDAAYRSIEASETDLTRRSDEDDKKYAARRAEHHARLLGHARGHDEQEHLFHSRIQESVAKLKNAAAGARDRLARAAGGAGDAISSAAHKVSAGAGAAGHAMHDGIDAMRTQGAKASDAIKQSVSDGKDRIEAMYADNPVLGLAVGIGIGAILGAVVPMSRQEEAMLSKPVNKAATAAARLGEQAFDKIDKMAADTLRQAGAPVQSSSAPGPA